MPYSKRQIIEVFYDFSDGAKVHPAIILSIPEIFDDEGYYICALISSSAPKDRYSFCLRDNDTLKPLKEGSCVRTHLIIQVFEEDINKVTPHNYLKEDAFDRLIDFIEEAVFGLQFDP